MPYRSNLAVAFEEVVARYAGRTALHYPATNERVTYRDLAALANRIASIFWAKGLRQGEVAAFFNDKSPTAFAAMLACLRLGIIYTNLDPESPWERNRKILATCQPHLIVNAFADLPFKEGLEEQGLRNVLHLRDLPNMTASETMPDHRTITGASPAYIMFTSGSTGNPKGAVMSHANLLGLIAWGQDRFGITCDDVITNVNPIYFDNSVFDFYTAIFSGATLLPVTPAQAKDTRLLVRLVNEAGCTTWFSVPSLLVYLLTTRAVTANDFPKIRKIIFGGEGFPKPKLKQLYDLFGSRATLENVYGPTECTCICSAHSISDADFEDMQNLATLGKLAQNFDYEILPQDESDPDPDFGELFLRGPQVGLGYYNDRERTAKSFIPNPRHNLYADIGYRTGDLVRRDAQGNLHFKGRVDFQIKHMGYRIELEEIEAAVGTLAGVKECAVIYQKSADGFGQIIAFTAMNTPAAPEELLRQIAAIVPPYMLPRRMHVMEHLPKNANGKIDRIALQTHATSA
ncbi:MAG: amino acid adenylation domain-containing protein [Burkholderiales bacterium]|nr:amino acid adenylation domain-containing protein [Burkholderiales bacterium]